MPENELQNNDEISGFSEESGGAAVGTENLTDEARAYAEQQEAFEKQRAQMAEQDQKLIEALDEVLEKRSRKTERQTASKRPLTRSESIRAGVVNKGVGIVSLGLILIFLGVVLIVTLFSPEPDYLLPLKLSPVTAILIGIEILFNQMTARGRFRVNIPSVIISAALTVGCCTMGVVLNSAYKEDAIEYNNRTIAAEIYDRTYKELRNSADIKSIEVHVDLNPGGSAAEKGLDALSSGDNIVIDVVFGGVFRNPADFAASCKKIIDGYRIMNINVTDFHFINSSAFHSYKLDVIGKYVQDYSEKRLTELVDYIYIEDYSFLEDLSELEDEEEKSEPKVDRKEQNFD